MRKISPILIVLLVFSACDTDFELEAPWQDIPVVNGFLSLQDTAHYIRIERAFQQEGTDARDIAQNPDSIYYDENLIAELERINTGQRFPLQRIDGNLEGYPREDGPFTNSPNILYKIKASDINLRAGETIRLRIQRNEGAELATAETQILDDIFIRESNPVSPVNMAYDRNINFVFNVGEAAQLFDVRLLFRIRELENGQSNIQEIEWVLTDDQRRVSEEARVAVEITGEEFYRFLGSALSPRNGVQRFFEGFDLLVAAGGQEMVDLLTVQQANTGITSAQLIPIYTNLSRGRGIFSSRSTAIRRGLELNSSSQDSLRNGIFTRQLGFQ